MNWRLGLIFAVVFVLIYVLVTRTRARGGR
jgi:hypothetical protein